MLFGILRCVSIPSTSRTLIWQSSSRGVKRTLKGHAGQVTTVKSLGEGSERHQLISGDSVGEVRLWTTDNDQVGFTFRSLKDADGTVFEHINHGSQRLYICSGSSYRIRTSGWAHPDGWFGRIDQTLETRREAGTDADDRSEGQVAIGSTSSQSAWYLGYVISRHRGIRLTI